VLCCRAPNYEVLARLQSTSSPLRKRSRSCAAAIDRMRRKRGSIKKMEVLDEETRRMRRERLRLDRLKKNQD
jgi:hypothetical protein